MRACDVRHRQSSVDLLVMVQAGARPRIDSPYRCAVLISCGQLGDGVLRAIWPNAELGLLSPAIWTQDRQARLEEEPIARRMRPRALEEIIGIVLIVSGFRRDVCVDAREALTSHGKCIRDVDC